MQCHLHRLECLGGPREMVSRSAKLCICRCCTYPTTHLSRSQQAFLCRPGQTFTCHKSVYLDINIGTGELQTTSSGGPRLEGPGRPGIIEGIVKVMGLLLV